MLTLYKALSDSCCNVIFSIIYKQLGMDHFIFEGGVGQFLLGKNFFFSPLGCARIFFST